MSNSAPAAGRASPLGTAKKESETGFLAASQAEGAPSADGTSASSKVLRLDGSQGVRLASEPRSSLLVARNIHKSYRKGKIEVPVLRGASLEVRPGEFLAIMGQSGSGKTTLLHLLGCLDVPDEGEILFDGTRIDRLGTRARDRLRNEQIGMIFQFYHLLPELSTLENVLTPVMIRLGVWRYWLEGRGHRERAKELLTLVGLAHRWHHRPRELSGGEMQRAAIARALVGRPRLLLADEPTGNLDQQTGREILAILRRLNREQGLTVVMVTHDPAIARHADRTVRLVGGVVQAD